MKFKQFKAALREVYDKLLPEDEQFPSDEDLRTVNKKDRESFIRLAAVEAANYQLHKQARAVMEEYEDDNKTGSEDTATTASDIDKVLAERGTNYGKFTNHAKLSQHMKMLFERHVREHGNPELFTNSMNEAIEMILHKLARIANGDPTYDDSWRDISGYSELIVKELNGEVI